MTKEKAKLLEPFDIVTVKGKPGMADQDALVKAVTDSGVFCLFRVQSTATLVPFDQILD